MFKQTLFTVLILCIVALVGFGQLALAKSVSPLATISSIGGSSIYTNSFFITLYRKPSFVKYAPSGVIYVADTDDYRIRKISGDVPAIVGTGVRGDSGEGGLAVNAEIGIPYAFDVDPTGEVVFSDSNNKVKKILTNGILITIASNVSAMGVAYNPLTGEVYFSDNNVNAIKKIDSEGNIVTVAGGGSSNGDGPAFSVNLRNVTQLVFNSNGVLFFSEIHTNTIKQLNIGQITTIAGNGGSTFSGDGVLATNTSLNLPTGLTIRPRSNDLVFADTNNNRIRLISASTGFISTIAGNGVGREGSLAINALLYKPRGVAYSPNGDLYIADTNSGRVRKVSVYDGIIISYSGGIFGDGLPVNPYGVLDRPMGVAISSASEVIIADTNNLRIRKVSLNGIISTIAGLVDIYSVLSRKLKSPVSVTTRPNGDVYFADNEDSRILKISAIDGTISIVAGNGAIDQFTPDGALATDTVIGRVMSIGFNSKGELIYSETTNNRIRKVLANGTVVTVAGIGQFGSIVGGFSGDGGLATNAGLNNPTGLVVTPSDNIIFMDTLNFRIRMILNNGTITTIAGNGDLGYTEDGKLATDSALYLRTGIAMNSIGEIYFTEYHRLRKMSKDGTLTTIAGEYGNNNGFSGDGGLAKDALLNGPSGVAVDSNDNIYVADTDNSRIRKISLVCPFPYVMNGSECIPTCFGVSSASSQVCSAHGYCNETDTCICQLGYYGNNCELFDCNGIAKNSSQVCNYHGICQSPNSCSCQSKYYGSDCELFDCNGVPKNSSQVCSSHGTCQYPNNCTCQSGYFGTNCESFNCSKIDSNSPQVCSSHGYCNETDTCICQLGYYGNNCELFDCNGIAKNSSQVCNYRGICQSPNSCSCQSKYYGSDCELFDCNGVPKNSSQVCSSHGTCQYPNNCSCQSKYYGSDCELFDCNGIAKNSSQVCNYRGICQSHNSCSCQSKYYGSDCELFDCNGVPKNSSQVCSSHGTCQYPNNCSCQSTYYGSDCELFDCNGVPKNSSQVCSSHGTCQYPNNCSCQSKYYGTDCELFDCNGVPKNSSQVCSSHGTCQYPNNCTCQSGYFGTNCESFNCSKIDSNSPQVCSSHGTCQGPNSCSCQTGYYGTNCELFNCTGIKSTEPTVCSSKGQCTAPNNCKCSATTFGSNCEFTVTSSNNINGTISQFKLNHAFKASLSTPLLILCMFFALLLLY